MCPQTWALSCIRENTAALFNLHFYVMSLWIVQILTPVIRIMLSPFLHLESFFPRIISLCKGAKTYYHAFLRHTTAFSDAKSIAWNPAGKFWLEVNTCSFTTVTFSVHLCESTWGLIAFPRVIFSNWLQMAFRLQEGGKENFLFYVELCWNFQDTNTFV